jgi:hypothetical protein
LHRLIQVLHHFQRVFKEYLVPDTKTFMATFGKVKFIQGAAERTPRFGRSIASGGERVLWWGVRRRTAVYVPFSVYTIAWSGEHRAFIVEEFMKNGGSPVATQRAFRRRRVRQR